MEEVNTKKVALTLGILFAVLHTIGVLLMSPLIKYWTWVHFVSIQYAVQPFNFVTLIVGIVGAFLGGLILGWLFALIYNKLS